MLVTCAGILLVDLIAADLPKVSDPGELTYAPGGIETHMGGHSGNVSIDLRKLGLRKGEVSSVGAVGEDVFGDFLEGLLKKHGVITHLQRVPKVGTSKDLILVVAGEDRRFHVDVGANWYLSPEYVLSVLEKERPLIFYAGGVGFTGKFDEQLAEVLQRAKDLECLTFIDPLTPYKHGWGFIIPPIEWTDIFHCNKDEAKAITGKDDPREAAKVMTDKGAQLVIISFGDRGLIAETKETLFEMPAFKVPVVDPSGAGDAMCAGVIRALLKTIDYKRRELSELSTDEIARILLEGEAAGASCVTMVGTTTAVTEENVNKILKEQEEKILSHLKVTPL
jgi:sugar/nucleoside kinase (ribokinase family)